MERRKLMELARPGRGSDKNPPTRELAHARTRELAVAAGRTPLQITQADYERARRELTGESDMARQEAAFEEAERWGRPSPSRDEPAGRAEGGAP